MDRIRFVVRHGIFVLAVYATSSFAQSVVDANPSVSTLAGPPIVALQAKVATGRIGIRIEDGMDAKPVKGSPFCGTITSDHTQTFADGNRIHTAESSLLCRDSQGRIRREAQMNLLGAVPQSELPKIVTIVDPVAGYRYLLDSRAKIAHKMPIAPPGLPPLNGKEAGQVAVMVRNEGVGTGPGPGPGNAVYFSSQTITSGTPSQPASNSAETSSTENLGDQTIDDLHATGTRTTTTIKAGVIGNDQPISIVSETWYSPELNATVMTKHTDPWAGELKTQLTNVNYSEPDPSLFSIPSDYRVVDDKPVQIKLPPAPPPQ
ncbi:MAG TPA: hypothetical protein VKW78_11020 [Terriglobales bacterium]|nr:hypothetical protein [Terriglobales bacterium]